MTENLTTLDVAEHLESHEAIADFMAAAFQTKDPTYIAHALECPRAGMPKRWAYSRAPKA